MKNAGEFPLVHMAAYTWQNSTNPADRKIRGSERRYLNCRSKSAGDLHYRPHLYQLASGPVAAMGFREYLALHLRRNDFQYQQAPEAGEWLVNTITGHAKPGEPIYIASDEVSTEWWNNVRQVLAANNHTVFTFTQFLPELL